MDANFAFKYHVSLISIIFIHLFFYFHSCMFSILTHFDTLNIGFVGTLSYTPEIVHRYNILGLKKTHTVPYWFVAKYLRCGFQLRTRYICQSFFWSTGLWVRPSVMHESESVNRRISVFALRCEGRGGRSY